MPRITVLYHRSDEAPFGTSVRRHQHAFWQLEAVRRGRVEITVNDATTVLRSGRFFLIPPQRPHALRYPVAAEYLSIKFESADVPPSLTGLMPDSSCARQVLGALALLLPAGETRRTILAEEVAALGAMLLAHWHRLGVRPPDISDGPAARLKSRADAARGRVRNVETITRAAGLSRGRALAVFQAAYGRSLKAYLDDVAANEAAALLCYSERSVGEIADALAFPDLFAFSRFFRRTRGQSPSVYRESVRAQRESLRTPQPPPTGRAKESRASRRETPLIHGRQSAQKAGC